MSAEIWEALESCTASRDEHRVTTTTREVALRKKSLLTFLEEIDGSLTVEEVREALDGYRIDWR